MPISILAELDDAHILSLAITKNGLVSDGSNLDDAAIARRVDDEAAVLIAHGSLHEC